MLQEGFFITFEGIDGCGKSTQLNLTAKYLADHGRSPLILREPGSTPVSERIRDLLLDRRLSINPTTELMLYLAARAELVREVIAPAIAAGKIVLCDRFYDSTTAYQGYGRGLNIDLLERLHGLIVEKQRPHLTFLIDVDYETSLARRKPVNDRLESESREFFDRVRNGFMEIAAREKDRIVVLDGRLPVADIFSEVKNWLGRKLRPARIE